MSAQSSTLKINTPRVFLPLLKPSRYKGAHGGRGSGKSHFFAERLVEESIVERIRGVCIREVQKSIKQSVKLLISDKIKSMGVESMFEIQDAQIKGPNDSLFIFQGMQDHNADSIKSLEAFNRAWVEEAQTMSQRSLDLLRPTIRAPQSELWFSWNPESPKSSVDQLLRGKKKVTNSIVVEANWRDNPYFPEELRVEMDTDKTRDEDKYYHIWEGQYRQTLEGAIYGKEIREAYKDNRITSVPYSDRKPVTAVWDLGYADFCSIWFVQIFPGEIRIIDFYQNQFQKTAHYCKVMQDKEYQYDEIILPHDAAEERINTDRTTEQQVFAAFPNASVIVLPNLGPGYKNVGIEAVRNIFPTCYFDEENCEQGLDNLKEYRYEKDESNGTWSRTPVHDNASHAADAFRYLAISIADAPYNSKKRGDNVRIERRNCWTA